MVAKTKATAIDRIRASVSGEMLSHDILAWSTDDEIFTVYWTPITLAEKQKISRTAKGDDQLTTLYTFIFKALDENGDKMFTVENKRELMNSIGSKEIEEVALKILGIDDERITPEK